MTDIMSANECELTIQPTNQKRRKSSSQVENSPSSRRSSRASISSIDQVEVTKKRTESDVSIIPFDSSILNIHPQDLKKLEMMSEVYSDDEQPFEDEPEDSEGIESHVPTNQQQSTKDCNNNNEYYTEAETHDLDVMKEIDENKIIELKEAFELFDINGDGLITHSDLKKTFISLGQDISDEEITKMLDDGSKPLDEEAFIKMVGERTIHLDPEYIMSEALSKWDRDGSGLIPLAKIRGDLMAAGDRFTEDEVEMALEEAPIIIVKGRKMINYKEFSQSLCCIRKAKLIEE